MYRIYGRDRLYNYELIKKEIESLKEVIEIANNNNDYEELMIIKTENNTDEIVNIEKKERPKIFRKKKW